MFEHVHGESRDRGQAMVDLLEMYRSKGFELDSRQMPDYIPLFLEFLSEQDEPFAREWLADVSHILALLEERLQQRESEAAHLFAGLLTLSCADVDREQIRKIVSQEKQDDSMEAIDLDWEDKEVRFDEPLNANSCGANQGCAPSTEGLSSQNGNNIEIPVTWHDRFTGEAITR